MCWRPEIISGRQVFQLPEKRPLEWGEHLKRGGGMAAKTTKTAASRGEKRSKGRPARIDRHKILEAARTLAPEDVTMQSVADILGVDPTALNYHVGGKREFMQLIALDRASMSLDVLAELTEGDWESLLRGFASGMRASVASIGPLARYLEFDSRLALGYMISIEKALETLVDAGLSSADALRSISLVAHLAAHTGKRDTMCDSSGAQGLHGNGVKTLLEGEAGTDLPIIRALLKGEYPGFAPEDPASADLQFTFELDTIIEGIRSRMTR